MIKSSNEKRSLKATFYHYDGFFILRLISLYEIRPLYCLYAYFQMAALILN